MVLFNLGGPDGPAAVKPFLYNLFSDPAIIAAPAFARKPIAAFIAASRERSAMANYAHMGGGSPILGETRRQAEALESSLRRRRPDDEIRVFVAMRYWKPRAAEIAGAVRWFAPDDVVLAPLYPQYSTTTTASSMAEWHDHYDARCRDICCWFSNPGLIEAHAQRIEEAWTAAGRPKVRLLFSAHGLPRRIAESGDPYVWQVGETCAKVAERLPGDWDWSICYQSRVGPVKWLEPSTPQAILRAAADGVGVLIDPIAFVSEHIETLVELDRDYAELARKAGIGVYLRAAAVGTAAPFIDGLADAVERALARGAGGPDGRACPAAFGRCGRKEAACSTTS